MDTSGVMGEGVIAFFFNLRSCCIDDDEVDERVVSTAGRPACTGARKYAFLVIEEAYCCYLHIRVHTSISLSHTYIYVHDTHMQLASLFLLAHLTYVGD